MLVDHKGVVSVWLGSCTNSDVFWSYLNEDYTKDGDIVPSIFASEFGLGEYEIELQEADYFGIEMSVIEFLSNASYSSSYAKEVARKSKILGINEVNCGVLLFDFEVVPKIPSSNGIYFIGVFSYDILAPMIAEQQG